MIHRQAKNKINLFIALLFLPVAIISGSLILGFLCVVGAILAAYNIYQRYKSERNSVW